MLSYHLHHFVLHQQGTEVSRSSLQSTSHRSSTQKNLIIHAISHETDYKNCGMSSCAISSDPQLRGEILALRFCFVCPSSVSTRRLGKAGREGHDTLSCPVFPPNHILRSGNLADILGTSCSVIMKFQRIPKNLETACSSS